jgi:hypothetical protein
LAFVDNPEGKPQVNHKDGDKLNNNAENLEWCTGAENVRHAVRLGLSDPRENTRKSGSVKLDFEAAREIRQLFEDGWPYKAIGEAYNIRPNYVWQVVHERWL